MSMVGELWHAGLVAEEKGRVGGNTQWLKVVQNDMFIPLWNRKVTFPSGLVLLGKDTSMMMVMCSIISTCN